MGVLNHKSGTSNLYTLHSNSTMISTATTTKRSNPNAWSGTVKSPIGGFNTTSQYILNQLSEQAARYHISRRGIHHYITFSAIWWDEIWKWNTQLICYWINNHTVGQPLTHWYFYDECTGWLKRFLSHSWVTVIRLSNICHPFWKIFYHFIKVTTMNEKCTPCLLPHLCGPFCPCFFFFPSQPYK